MGREKSNAVGSHWLPGGDALCAAFRQEDRSVREERQADTQ